MRIRLFLLAVALLFSGVTLELVRRRLLRAHYALLWMGLAVGVFVIALAPQVITWLVNLSGMDYQSVVIVMLFVFAGLMFMAFSVIVSRHGGRVIRLSQEVALLRAQLDELADRMKKSR